MPEVGGGHPLPRGRVAATAGGLVAGLGGCGDERGQLTSEAPPHTKAAPSTESWGWHNMALRWCGGGAPALSDSVAGDGARLPKPTPGPMKFLPPIVGRLGVLCSS